MVRIGVQLLPDYTSFAAYRRAWLDLDAMGVDSLWTWDHLFPLSYRRFGRLRRLFGPPVGPSFEG